MKTIKVHKYLSDSGLCSRRKAEEFVELGLVYVNSKVAYKGQRIDPELDEITYDNKSIIKRHKTVYYKFNKPKGIITTCSTNGEKNILDIVDIKERVFPIGRLDKNTDGLILLTNDGRLSNKLMHPSFEHSKTYVVKVYGSIDDEKLDILRDGVFIIKGKTKPCIIERISSGTFKITLQEGRNRQIRRMVNKVGLEVRYLRRIKIENIELGNLEPGEYSKLSSKELKELLSRCGIS